VTKMCYPTQVSLPIRLALQLRLQISRLALLAIVCGLAGMFFATVGRAQESQAPPQPIGAPASLPPSSLLSPEQVRPGEPQVSFDGKRLTIIANKSTLSDILAAVRASTGAEIDVPAGASGEKLAEVRLGPGPAREVLASLLSWTDFGYIIQASDSNPEGIQSVLLVARSKTPAGGAAGPGAFASQSRMGANRRVAEPDPIPVVPVVPVEPPAPVNPVPPQPGPSAEVAPAEPQQQLARPALESNPNQQQFRTTEQMIQELQGMYQQRQQMQRIQPPPIAPKPPTAN
jgi:hypothetical protein